MLVIGLVSPVLVFVRLVPPSLLSPSFKLAPILIAVGVVLLRSSAAALGRADSQPPAVLSVGEASLRIGLVLLLEGWFLPEVLQGLGGGLGFLGTLVWIDSFPAGLVLLVLGAMIQAIEVKRRSIRVVFGLAATILACTGTVVFASRPPAGRIGAGWLPTVAEFGDTAMLLVGVLVAIVSAQAGAGRYKTARPRGLYPGRNSLWVGALCLGVGIFLSVSMYFNVLPLALYYVCRKMPPILTALGAVLLLRSIVAAGRVGDDRASASTLGEATLGMGFVLLLLGCSAPLASSGPGRLPGFLGLILRLDCVPAGLALLILGALIRAAERQLPRVGVRETPGDSRSGHEPHVGIGSRPMVSRPEPVGADRLSPLDLGPRSVE